MMHLCTTNLSGVYEPHSTKSIFKVGYRCCFLFEINSSIVMTLQWPVWAFLSCKSVISTGNAILCLQCNRLLIFPNGNVHERGYKVNSSSNTYTMTWPRRLLPSYWYLGLIFAQFSFFKTLSMNRHHLMHVQIHTLRRAQQFTFISGPWLTPQPRHPKWRQTRWHNKGKSHILWVICD